MSNKTHIFFFFAKDGQCGITPEDGDEIKKYELTIAVNGL